NPGPNPSPNPIRNRNQNQNQAIKSVEGMQVANIQEVTDSEFESVVLKADKPVLVDFWATWCGPCRMIAPIVEQIHGELGDKIKVLKMDIDENPSVPMQLGIMSIPTVIIFKDGKPAERTVGYRPNMKGDLKANVEALI